MKTRYYLIIGLVCACSYFGYRIFYPVTDQGSNRDRETAMESNESGYSALKVPEPPTATPVDQQMIKADPKNDHWESEVLNDQVARQLDRLRIYIDGFSADQHDEEITGVVAEDFRCGALRPDDLKIVFDDAMFRVRRPSIPTAGSAKFSDLRKALQVLLTNETSPKPVSETHPSGPRTQTHFKVVDIRPAGAGFATRVLVEISRPTAAGYESVNATWLCKWKRDGMGTPRLLSIEAVDYEDVVLKSEALFFEDVTSAVFDVADSDIDHLLRGIDYWCHRITRIDDMRMHGHHGFAVGDVNGDQLEDLYVCDAGGLPNRLYLQNQDGTVLDCSKASGTDWLESSVSALLVDLDNDGDQDLIVATVAGIIFASNDGAGHFTPRAAQPGMREAHSMCAADYDNDGDLDLYICIYGRSSSPGGQSGFEAELPIPYSNANNGGANVLLNNQGSFRFVDATSQCGLDDNNHRWSFAAAWEDYDADGDVDLYVANDFGRNNLYRNDGGKFRDVAAELGVEDRASGMSAAWADFNRDGHRDLYIGNMFSAAGQRVTYQRTFLANRSSTNASDIQRMARGNTLFMAHESGSFHDVSQAAAVTMGRWSWGAKPVDLNNDGYEDVVVANGYFTNTKTDDL